MHSCVLFFEEAWIAVSMVNIASQKAWFSLHPSMVAKTCAIRDRICCGRAARDRGRNGGRPRKLKTKDIQAIKALMHAAELPAQVIADRFGVARSTLYRNAARPESPKMLKTQAGGTHTSTNE
jgi:hypothetical protein